MFGFEQSTCTVEAKMHVRPLSVYNMNVINIADIVQTS